MPARAGHLAQLRAVLRDWLRRFDLPEEDFVEFQIAVGEAASNAAEHAYRDAPADTIEVTLTVDGCGICAEVTDHGRWRPPHPDPGSRGHGIGLMKECADEMTLRSDHSGTTVVLRKRLPQPRPPDNVRR